jgi:hypothetical protein
VRRAHPRPAHALAPDEHATYFQLDAPDASFIVELAKIQTADEKFVIRLSPEVLDSDDAIVAVLAHEVHEARALAAELGKSGGRLTAGRVGLAPRIALPRLQPTKVRRRHG